MSEIQAMAKRYSKDRRLIKWKKNLVTKAALCTIYDVNRAFPDIKNPAEFAARFNEVWQEASSTLFGSRIDLEDYISTHLNRTLTPHKMYQRADKMSRYPPENPTTNDVKPIYQETHKILEPILNRMKKKYISSYASRRKQR